MDTPAIEVTPIRNISSGPIADMFIQVFFNGVRVPVANRLGAEGQGWQIVMSALQNERSGLVEVASLAHALEELIGLARRCSRNARPALEDPGLRRQLARMEARIEAMRLNGMRALTQQLQGAQHESQSSLNKLHLCDLLVEMAELGVELLGERGLYKQGSDQAVDDGLWQVKTLSWPATVIGGGAPNIQKNIIAERILGLAKD